MPQTVLQSPYEPGGIAGRGGPKKPTPRWLVGCLGLIVGGGLLLTALSIGVSVWALAPGEQASSLAAIGPGTRIALHLRDEPGHAGVDALLDHVGVVLGELDAARRRGRLPEGAEWLQQAEQRRTADADTLRLFLPAEATIALDGAREEPLPLLIVNPHHLVRLLRAGLWAAAAPGTIHEEDDALWYATGGSFLGFRGGNVLWAQSEDRLKGGFLRLRAEPAAARSPVRDAITPMAARWHLSLHARAPVDELRAYVRDALARLDESRRPPPEEPAVAERADDATLSLGLAVVDADSFEGELRWEADDKAASGRLQEAALQALAGIQRRAAEHGLTFTFDELPGGGGVTLRCRGVEAFLDAMALRFATEIEARERRR